MEEATRAPARFTGLVLAAGLFSMSVCASPSEGNPVAHTYAQTYGVSVDEAARRLARQADIGALEQRMQTERPDTFAGLYIEHRPAYRVVVRFTGDAQAQLAAYTGDPLYVAQTAPRSLQVLRGTQDLLGQRLHAAGIEFMSGTDVKTSQVDIYVLDVEKAMECLAELPVMKEGFVRVHKTGGFIETT